MDKSKDIYIKSLHAAAWVVIGTMAVYFLTIADYLLIPFVFAILLWYLINVLEHSMSKIRIRKLQIPRWIRILVALLIIIQVFNIVAGIIVVNVSKIIEVAPQYQRNLERLLLDLPFGLKPEEIPVVTWLTQELNIARVIQRAAMGLTGTLGNIGLILIYLIFLFLEQKYFNSKIEKAAGNDKNYRLIKDILSAIDRDIRRYVGVKSLVSFITAVASWGVMKWVGLEFASFWALLIFILNFIPNIGSLIATVMPVLLALLQFDTLRPAVMTFIGIGAIQMTVGNFIDPALLGKSLNVSPLVIVLSLVFWGAIWGLPGLFLAVPITVILMIVLNSFESTRWVAKMLSRNGNLKSLHTS